MALTGRLSELIPGSDYPDVEIQENCQQLALIVQDLLDVGMRFEPPVNYGDLFTRPDYELAIPVLMKWFQEPLRRDIETILIGAMRSRQHARFFVPLLLKRWFQLKKHPPLEVDYEILTWAIGATLETLVAEWWADDLLDLAQDVTNGKARQMPVMGVGKLKDPRASEVLVGLLDDPEVFGHAIYGLGRLKDERARPIFERFLDHPEAWIRQEARAAIKKLDRAAARREGKASTKPADPSTSLPAPRIRAVTFPKPTPPSD